MNRLPQQAKIFIAGSIPDPDLENDDAWSDPPDDWELLVMKVLDRSDPKAIRLSFWAPAEEDGTSRTYETTLPLALALEAERFFYDCRDRGILVAPAAIEDHLAERN